MSARWGFPEPTGQIPNPQPDPQSVLSCTPCGYFGSPTVLEVVVKPHHAGLSGQMPAASAAARIIGKRNGWTKQFGWLQPAATRIFSARNLCAGVPPVRKRCGKAMLADKKGNPQLWIRPALRMRMVVSFLRVRCGTAFCNMQSRGMPRCFLNQNQCPSADAHCKEGKSLIPCPKLKCSPVLLKI
jgi:hypothetical protein